VRNVADSRPEGLEKGPRIVPFAEAHANAVVELIGAVFAEYGMTFEPSGFDVDLTAIREHYVARGGWFAVLTDDGQVVGTVAALPRGEGICEVRRLYLRPEYRGRGHGRALMDYVLARAREHELKTVIAWSDARLVRSHRMYEGLGFERFGTRVAEDADRSREYGFRRPVDG
jgi:putative acetyltransferase